MEIIWEAHCSQICVGIYALSEYIIFQNLLQIVFCSDVYCNKFLIKIKNYLKNIMVKCIEIEKNPLVFMVNTRYFSVVS